MSRAWGSSCEGARDTRHMDRGVLARERCGTCEKPMAPSKGPRSIITCCSCPTEASQPPYVFVLPDAAVVFSAFHHWKNGGSKCGVTSSGAGPEASCGASMNSWTASASKHASGIQAARPCLAGGCTGSRVDHQRRVGNAQARPGPRLPPRNQIVLPGFMRCSCIAC